MTGQGHEFTGTVEEIGPAVRNFEVGDRVVSPFTTSWLVYLRDSVFSYNSTVRVLIFAARTASIARMAFLPGVLKGCCSDPQLSMELRRNM